MGEGNPRGGRARVVPLPQAPTPPPTRFDQVDDGSGNAAAFPCSPVPRQDEQNFFFRIIGRRIFPVSPGDGGEMESDGAIGKAGLPEEKFSEGEGGV